MFGNIKPAASLSSGLLARKGQARPAMRPQGYVDFGHNGLEDLGWNDMGTGADFVAEAPAPATLPVPSVLRQREALRVEVEALAQQDVAPAPVPDAEPDPQPEPALSAVPAPVIELAPAAQPAVEEAPVARRSVSVNTAQRLQRETRARKGKAAFTLRLDADRHLQLRLASALRGKSAQALVTEALDTMLASLPEVATLIDQLPAGSKR